MLGGLFNFEEMLVDQVVFKEGEIGDKFYLIVSGSVEVCVKRADSFYLLDTLGPDDWFGEIALMRHTPRTATVTCKSDSVFLTLTSDKFRKFLTVAPELTEHFQALLQHRTANILKTMDLFKYLNENKPWSKVEMMGALFNYELKRENEMIYKQNDEPDKFYLLMSGSVALENVERKERTLLKAQNHFGEFDLLIGRKRTENCISLDTSILLYINSDAFFQLMKVAPELRTYFEQEERKRQIKQQENNHIQLQQQNKNSEVIINQNEQQIEHQHMQSSSSSAPTIDSSSSASSSSTSTSLSLSSSTLPSSSSSSASSLLSSSLSDVSDVHTVRMHSRPAASNVIPVNSSSNTNSSSSSSSSSSSGVSLDGVSFSLISKNRSGQRLHFVSATQENNHKIENETKNEENKQTSENTEMSKVE